jgi:hypothetical protein
MVSPRSIRFDESVTRRLASFVARHPGASSSAVAARFVDEGLRMVEFPGILFRDGPLGRRAGLAGGPDVWEVIRTVRGTREAEPGLGETELIALVGDNSGLPTGQVRLALDYWSSYPTEVDAFLEHAATAESAHQEAWERVHGLLTR